MDMSRRVFPSIIFLLLFVGCGRRHSSNPPLPTFGGLISASATSDTTIQLGWLPATDRNTPQNQITYLVYQATASGQENFSVPAAVTDPGAAIYVVGNLNPSATYFFVVRARNLAGGIDQNSVEKSATTAASGSSSIDTLPPTVSITAPAAWSALSGAATLTASATDNVGVARVEFYTNGATLIGSQSTSGPNVSASIAWDTTRAPDGVYTLTAKAYDAANNSAISPGVIVTVANTPDNTKPSIPQNFSATAVSAERIDLRWSSSSDFTDNGSPGQVAGYRIERSGDGITFTEIAIASTNFYADAGLTAGATYFYRIRAFDLKGNLSDYSASAGATTLAAASATTLGGSLNVDSANPAANPFLALYSDGTLYAAWKEAPQVYVKQYIPNQNCWGDGAVCGALVGGTGLRVAPNPQDNIEHPGIAFVGTYLYVAWEEIPSSNIVKVKRCLITACAGWEDVSSGIMQDAYAFAPFIASDGSAPYLAWIESTTSRQEIWVKQFNATNWVPVGTLPLNKSGSFDADNFLRPGLAFSATQVAHATWAEPDINPSPRQIWVKRLSGAWLLLGKGSLNVNAGQEARGPSIALNGEVPIVAWQEQDSLDPSVWRIYVKQWIQAQSCWGDGTSCGALLGGGAASGAGNTQTSNVADRPVAVAFDPSGTPYLTFSEIDFSNFGRIYLKKLLCANGFCSWDIISGGSLNVNNKYAQSPFVLMNGATAYVAWEETAPNTPVTQVYVRSLQ